MEHVISKFKQNKVSQIFTISLRYLIGSAFVFASIIKIEGNRFTSDSGAKEPINTAWHFFETMYQSGLYWNFIGWGQFIAGLLLMTQYFSTLGAIIFLPIVLNVFVITISYPFGGTPVITFLMTLGIFYLLLWDWNKLKFILPNPKNYVDDLPEFSKRKIWIRLGTIYFFVVILMQKLLIGDKLAKYFNIKHSGFSFAMMLSVFLLVFGSWLFVAIDQFRKKVTYK